MPTLTDAPSVQPLAELAVFQPGSIVSRMLLKNKAGSATLFAFAEGEGLSEHTAPFDALVVVTDGTAEITIDGTPHTVGAGETLRLPADVPHAVLAPTDVRMLLIMLRA
jgi:quercetin dioxygenase-like cupin family protein